VQRAAASGTFVAKTDAIHPGDDFDFLCAIPTVHSEAASSSRDIVRGDISIIRKRWFPGGRAERGMLFRLNRR
jgi:hypothetical protein